MTVVLYLVVVIPQNKKRKDYNTMIMNLKVNDEIISTGGLIGRVLDIEEDNVVFQCGPDKVKLKLSKSGILHKLITDGESDMQS